MRATNTVIIATIYVKSPVGSYSIHIQVFFLPSIVVRPFCIFFFGAFYKHTDLYTIYHMSCDRRSTSIYFAFCELRTFRITRHQIFTSGNLGIITY